MKRDSNKPTGKSTAACKFDHENAAVEVLFARLLISAKKENKMAVKEGVARLKRGRLLGTELILVARLNLSLSGLSRLQWQYVTTISAPTFISFNSS